MVLYTIGDNIEYRPFGGEVKSGKIEKMDVKTGGHVDIKYHVNGDVILSAQILGKKR